MSIVAAPCLRLVHAAWWNGKAPHTMTGDARASEAHCQLSNWNMGTIAISTTGMVRTVEMTRRWRSDASSGFGASTGSPASSTGALAGGVGRVAVYPVASTTTTASSTLVPSGRMTRATSVA